MQALDVAFTERFSRFEGGSYYHLGVTAGGYVLAKPGIPFFAAPKSILIFTVIVVEDHTGKVLTEEPHQITVIERLTGGSILGSGFTRSRAQQMRDLSKQAARKPKIGCANNLGLTDPIPLLFCSMMRMRIPAAQGQSERGPDGFATRVLISAALSNIRPAISQSRAACPL